ncbi:hypothetical protein EBB07_24690 [Paenibacillaceae bacterium]|nr:hypothetical protein EBB07_24690 [Paenibacillaceae bacterium]
MEIQKILQLLLFGVIANVAGGLNYKFLGGKLTDILFVLMWINVGMFVLSAIYYEFSFILFIALIIVNLSYYRTYRKITKK